MNVKALAGKLPMTAVLDTVSRLTLVTTGLLRAPILDPTRHYQTAD